MTSNSRERVDSIFDWVDRQVLTTQSSSITTNTYNLNPSNFLQPTVDPSTVSFLPCSLSERVCFSTLHLQDHQNRDFFYIYEILFTNFGLRLPFSDFQLQILNTINVAPTQLHPNAWAFLISFENLCQSFRFAPTVAVFFYFFQAVGVKEKEKMSWVSIRAREDRTKILTFEQWCAPFANKFFRVEGRRGSAGLPFFMGENKKPKFPLYWTRKTESPKPPEYSTFSPSEKDCVEKLQKLKEPFQCVAYFSRTSNNVPLTISPLQNFISNIRGSNQGVEVAGGLQKRKQFVTSTREPRKNQRVLLENSPTPTPTPPPLPPPPPPPLPPMVVDLEGDRTGPASSGQRNAFEFNGTIRNQEKLCSMGLTDLGGFLKEMSMQGAIGVKLLIEKTEVMQKEMSRLESELNEERSARNKAEEKVVEMEKELASARRDCEALNEIKAVLTRTSTNYTTTQRD
ncbi:hypothetical protein PIB30_029318 [Stylosanthes scabra]|uniref:Transposase (putative) gypsy type domain-containing protein n=1 Tax=Stylosanthes scabra TaxID=79078 RepID=A0ABU6Z831_9FABA|nr:hypothetical protein [Stylosanthes scabra]